MIQTTKFEKLNVAFQFALFTFEAIKLTILMFYSSESEIAIYLGEWTQYFGAKVVVDLI